MVFWEGEGCFGVLVSGAHSEAFSFLSSCHFSND